MTDTDTANALQGKEFATIFPSTAVVASASSDIGAALSHRWCEAGSRVIGTYRQESPKTAELRARGVNLVPCDLASSTSVADATQAIADAIGSWDALVLAAGAQEPIGLFGDVPFQAWEQSVRANLIGQLEVVHHLLPSRNLTTRLGPLVLFFAGGATNDAPTRYSAYMLSKIALIKMTELLDAEYSDTRFSIVGPGWVRTKIHDATLMAGSRAAGENHEKTQRQLASSTAMTPMEKVLDSCDWVWRSERNVVSGRNFSTAHDEWGSGQLATQLAADPNMYKLRRHGNVWSSGEGT